MRQVTETEYTAAKAAHAIYAEFSKVYLQKNGWTVIPSDAPYPVFDGASLKDTINAHSTNIELFELQRDHPEKFGAYVTKNKVTSWTGEQIGAVTWRGQKQRNNFGGSWCAINVQTDWGQIYHGREYDSRQYVNLRRVKAK